jgi:hypothetical protein
MAKSPSAFSLVTRAVAESCQTGPIIMGPVKDLTLPVA